MTLIVLPATVTATVVGYPIKFATGIKTTATDVMYVDTPGIIPLSIYTLANAACQASEDNWCYSFMRVSGAAYTTTSESIAYDEALVASDRPDGGYYVQNQSTGEIMYVIADSGYDGVTGTLTVMRGCLGTEAGAVADNAYLAILCSIELLGSIVGKEMICYMTLPEEPKAKIYHS